MRQDITDKKTERKDNQSNSLPAAAHRAKQDENEGLYVVGGVSGDLGGAEGDGEPDDGEYGGQKPGTPEAALSAPLLPPSERGAEAPV